jgi:hypothetical protein
VVAPVTARARPTGKNPHEGFPPAVIRIAVFREKQPPGFKNDNWLKMHS